VIFRPDAVVALFEAVSAVFICVSIRQLHKDKKVRGVSPWMIGFFGAWGWWNTYWYIFIDAPYAWWAGWSVVLSNTFYTLQMVYWIWKEKRQKLCTLLPTYKDAGKCEIAHPLRNACFHDHIKISSGLAYCVDCGDMPDFGQAR
jgi:hypothetical protein